MLLNRAIDGILPLRHFPFMDQRDYPFATISLKDKGYSLTSLVIQRADIAISVLGHLQNLSR